MELKEIERSIIKKYRKELWGRFTKGLKEFSLVEDGDKIAVGISGGKDSLLLAKMLQELQKHGNTKFELEFISMDPGFNNENRKLLEENCEKLGIPVQIRDSKVFEIAETVGEGKPCYLCARMRRGFLYNFANELGCNKLALGHHFDDVIETTLLNVFYASEFKTMLPKVKSQNYEGMALIRPLVYVKEAAILKWRDFSELRYMDCGCTIACKVDGSKRKEIKNFISAYRKIHPDVDLSIFESAKNVNMDAIMGYRKDGVKRLYLDDEATE